LPFVRQATRRITGGGSQGCGPGSLLPEKETGFFVYRFLCGGDNIKATIFGGPWPVAALASVGSVAT